MAQCPRSKVRPLCVPVAIRYGLYLFSSSRSDPTAIIPWLLNALPVYMGPWRFCNLGPDNWLNPEKCLDSLSRSARHWGNEASRRHGTLRLLLQDRFHGTRSPYSERDHTTPPEVMKTQMSQCWHLHHAYQSGH
jgi:hypothetical protein